MLSHSHTGTHLSPTNQCYTGNSANILLISLAAPPTISNPPFPPVAILLKTDSQQEMRLSVFAHRKQSSVHLQPLEKFECSLYAENKYFTEIHHQEQTAHNCCSSCSLLTLFFLERQLKCKRQCFCASTLSCRKQKICKPQIELFCPRPLQCKVHTLLLCVSVQGH